MRATLIFLFSLGAVIGVIGGNFVNNGQGLWLLFGILAAVIAVGITVTDPMSGTPKKR